MQPADGVTPARGPASPAGSAYGEMAMRRCGPAFCDHGMPAAVGQGTPARAGRGFAGRRLARRAAQAAV